MPFATLPSSPGFVAPQAPSWEPFALQANQFLANRPHVNTAEIIGQAAQQISQILALSSPEAKLERQLKLQQLQTMQSVYADYKQHPEKYQMTAHGPVMIDPIERMSKLANIQHTAASTAFLSKKLNQGTPAFITDAMKRMQIAQNAERQGVSLPASKAATPEPVASVTGNTGSQPDNSDTVAESEALTTPSAPDNPYNF